MKKEWLKHKDRDWLRNAPKGKLKRTLEAPNGQITNQSLEDFCKMHEENITKYCKFLAISGIMKDKQLIGNKTGMPIDLTEKRSMFYSRPGLYIIKQNPAQEFDPPPKRTHYVGEAKNLAKRLTDRSNDRKELFLEGSKITIIIKGTGTINQDQFFIHEVRTTCERMISDLIEEKWPGDAKCCNKPSWCFIHKKGVKQVGELELFVRHLLEEGIISGP